jgi:hypothetical protein
MFNADVGLNIAPGTSRKTAIDFPALEKSGKLIHENLVRDTQLLPDLKDLLQGPSF